MISIFPRRTTEGSKIQVWCPTSFWWEWESASSSLNSGGTSGNPCSFAEPHVVAFNAASGRHRCSTDPVLHDTEFDGGRQTRSLCPFLNAPLGRTMLRMLAVTLICRTFRSRAPCARAARARSSGVARARAPLGRRAGATRMGRFSGSMCRIDPDRNRTWICRHARGCEGLLPGLAPVRSLEANTDVTMDGFAFRCNNCAKPPRRPRMQTVGGCAPVVPGPLAAGLIAKLDRKKGVRRGTFNRRSRLQMYTGVEFNGTWEATGAAGIVVQDWLRSFWIRNGWVLLNDGSQEQLVQALGGHPVAILAQAGWSSSAVALLCARAGWGGQPVAILAQATHTRHARSCISLDVPASVYLRPFAMRRSGCSAAS